jgi:hypothetical protein
MKSKRIQSTEIGETKNSHIFFSVFTLIKMGFSMYRKRVFHLYDEIKIWQFNESDLSVQSE